MSTAGGAANSVLVEPGWMSEADFLTGRALVQAMPGPLFNNAAYVGKGNHICKLKSSTNS